MMDQGPQKDKKSQADMTRKIEIQNLNRIQQSIDCNLTTTKVVETAQKFRLDKDSDLWSQAGNFEG